MEAARRQHGNDDREHEAREGEARDATAHVH